MPEFYPEIREKKNALREEYRKKRSDLDMQQRQQKDEAIAKRFLSSISYRNAGVVLLYASTDEEIETYTIAHQALADGKTIAYPRCVAQDKRMVFHTVHSLAQLQDGAYGLFQPAQTQPVYDYESRAEADHAVAIVPGVVFDRDGYRVGYGKGYYDRFLRAFFGVKVGLAYSDHVLRTVPRGRYDLNVDMIVTEKGVLAVGR